MFSWIMFSPFFCYFHFVFWFTCMFCCLVPVIIYSYLQVGDLQIKRSEWNPEWVILFVKIQELSDFTLPWPL